MKTVVMEVTINYMMTQGQKEEVQKLLVDGQHKEIDGNIRYLLFKEN